MKLSRREWQQVAVSIGVLSVIGALVIAIFAVTLRLIDTDAESAIATDSSSTIIPIRGLFLTSPLGLEGRLCVQPDGSATLETQAARWGVVLPRSAIVRRADGSLVGLAAVSDCADAVVFGLPLSGHRVRADIVVLAR